MRRLRLAAILLSAAPAFVTAAPRAEPLPVETALAEKSLGLYSAIRLSPDQASVAYTVCDNRRVPPEPDPRYQAHSRTGVWRFGLGCDVWITDVATGESKNLTDGTASNWSPHWSPDGRLLAYYSDRSGTAALWIWSGATGMSRRVSDVIVRPWGLSGIAWTRDSRAVVIPLPEGVTIQQAAEGPGFLKGADPSKSADRGKTGEATVTVFENLPSAKGKAATAEAGAWSTELLRSDIARIEIETGSLRRLVTHEKPTGVWMSPDGSLVAVSLDRGFAASQSQQQIFDIDVVPTAGGPSRRLSRAVPLAGLGISAAWTPDGRSIGYTTGDGDAFVVPAAGGEPRKLTEAPVAGLSLDLLSMPFFDARGEWMHFHAGKKIFRLSTRARSPAKEVTPADREATALVPGGRPGQVLVLTRREDTKDEGLYELDLASGTAERLWEGPKYLGRDRDSRITAGSDVLVFTPQDAGHAEDLWALRRNGGKAAGEPRRLTHINPSFDEYAMGESRLIEWRSADGKPLRGALLLPAGYREGQRYPLVVFVYGGKQLSDALRSFSMREAWGADDNFQLLATRGYAVLLPDAPSDRKDQMRDLPKSVLPGVNRVIDLGIGDPERVGIMGHSNGGYSTLALITQTTRFKAAVMRAGFGNFVSFYGELGRDGTHYGLSVSESAFGMGNPWNSLTRYLENSPVLYLDRVETPLLIVHGSRDTAVAPHLAEEVFVDLQRLGKEVVLARYEGEGHQIEGFANQIDYCNRMIAWFDEHLKK
ncbi:MAG: prolyl oligopeptidase family serine peptidase [Acidobacteriota bacterium]